MKAFDSNTELQIIRTICDSPKRMEVLSKVTSEHFGHDSSVEIFNRIISLVSSGKAVPSSDVLKNDEALTEQSRALISSPQIRPLGEDDIAHAMRILTKYRKGRILLRTVQEAIEALKSNDPDIDSVVGSMETSLQRCHSGTDVKEMTHVCVDNVAELMKEVEELLADTTDDFIPSSFAEFDKKTGGFRRKNVIAMASVPGGGKSAMAAQMALNQFMMGFNVCFVSYEMDEFELKYRMLSCISKVDHGAINLKRLTQKQRLLISQKWEEFIRSSGIRNRLTLWCPTRELNISEIAIEIKPMGFDIIYIDYIGLLREYPGKAMWESLGMHARSAKLAANNLNSAMVLLCQYDDQENKLKYSKAIQANAHFVWAWDNGEIERESGIIEIKQLKARNAEVYPFHLQRDFSTMTFRDYSGPLPVKEPPPENQKGARGIPRMPELN